MHERRAPGRSSPILETRRPASSQLTGKWLVVARVAWIAIFVLTLSAFVVGIPAHLRQLSIASQTPQIWMQLAPRDIAALASFGVDIRFYASYLMMLEGLGVAAFAALGLLIFWLRPNDRIAMLVSAAAVLYGVTSFPVLQSLAQSRPEWGLPIALLNAVGWLSGILVFYRFPDARFVPRWTAWLALVLVPWTLAWPFLPALNPDHWSFPLPFLTKLFWYGSGVLAQVDRYRRYATSTERQQTKWAVYGFVVAFAGFVLFNIVSMLSVPFQDYEASFVLVMFVGYPLLIVFPLILVPVSLGFACLRAHLWDIDFLINRSLVYAILTGVLAVLYVACVVLFQQLFRTLTGIGDTLAITASTLALAVISAPLRRRVQAMIDRQFYRSKYDMEKALRTFNAHMRDQVDLERLTADLLSIVQDTMAPTQASLWLTPSAMHEGNDRPAVK